MVHSTSSSAASSAVEAASRTLVAEKGRYNDEDEESRSNLLPRKAAVLVDLPARESADGAKAKTPRVNIMLLLGIEAAAVEMISTEMEGRRIISRWRISLSSPYASVYRYSRERERRWNIALMARADGRSASRSRQK